MLSRHINQGSSVNPDLIIWRPSENISHFIPSRKSSVAFRNVRENLYEWYQGKKPRARVWSGRVSGEDYHRGESWAVLTISVTVKPLVVNPLRAWFMWRSSVFVVFLKSTVLLSRLQRAPCTPLSSHVWYIVTESWLSLWGEA